MVTNLLIFFHGMNTSSDPGSPNAKYDSIWNDMVTKEPDLAGKMAQIVKTEWGHQLSADPPARDDQKLSGAQTRIIQLIDRSTMQSANEPLDTFISDFSWLYPVRKVLNKYVRSQIIQRGFTDATYYISPEGEARVREAVYSQVLTQIAPHLGDTKVRLHVIADSLGVTVAHDFLFAMLNPDDGYEPGYTKQTDPSGSEKAALLAWREKMKNGDLTLGSFVAAGSQLPLFLLRKQQIVDTFESNASPADPRLDASKIGVTGPDVQWMLFYDVDDLLAYPTRHLYEPRTAIAEVQVDSGDRPDQAHTRYWGNGDVLEKAAKLILDRTG